MRWVTRTTGFPTTVTCMVRLFRTASVVLAPKRVVPSKTNGHTSATCRKTLSLPSLLSQSLPSSSSSLSSLASTHEGKPSSLSGGKKKNNKGNKRQEGAVSSRKETQGKEAVDTNQEEEERRLAEGDTRLAMRLLMQHHFLYQSNVRRPEDQRIEEERQQLREKHRARMERLEQKTRNSMELGSDVSVDGILPLYRRERASSTASTSKPIASWRRFNPIGAEALDGDVAHDDSSSLVGELLTKPDISVYNAEHDNRIRSSEVLEEEERHRREELKSGDATKKLLTKEELETGGGLTPQRVVQSQLLEDEDQDFAVEAYSGDYD